MVYNTFSLSIIILTLEVHNGNKSAGSIYGYTMSIAGTISGTSQVTGLLIDGGTLVSTTSSVSHGIRVSGNSGFGFKIGAVLYFQEAGVQWQGSGRNPFSDTGSAQYRRGQHRRMFHHP